MIGNSSCPSLTICFCFIQESSVKSSLSFKPIKQRVAHVAKTSAATGSLPRPRIPVEYGAKVPQNQRQRYLDRIIDEYLRLCSTQKEAFEKVDSTVINKIFTVIKSFLRGVMTKLTFGATKIWY